MRASLARFLESALLAPVLALALVSTSSAADWDLLIRGGTVVDGTGAPGVLRDVAIRGERIVAVGEALDPARAARVIEARGLIVAPGFIDNHAHVAPTIPDFPLEENFVRQGITTIIASLHSTDQPFPLAPYAASLRMAPNVAFFAGHTWIRKKVMGLHNRAPTAAELESMKSIVDQTMRDGALGLATGLEYVPATYATTEEVIALAKVAAAHGGIYMSHLRNEDVDSLKSIDEIIRIAREARIPVQVNHHKVAGAAQFGLSVKTLAAVEAARATGLDVKIDIYPYTAFSTYSDVMFPAWSLAGGSAEFAKRVADPTTRARMETEMVTIFPQQAGNGPASIQFRTLARHPEYNGRTLADYLADRKQPTTIAAAIPALIELQLEGSFDAIFHSMDEADVIRFMKYPGAMFETDGDPIGFGMGFPHPRSYGTFPRVLARYVRDLKVLTLEDAIRRMTSLPADQINQKERGRIREGAFADITIFDAAKVQDLATFTDPHRFPVGIVHVLVNGRPIIRGGALTGEMPGKVLRGPAR
jgi:N-acyl-D-amino-acid deacylase